MWNRGGHGKAGHGRWVEHAGGLHGVMSLVVGLAGQQGLSRGQCLDICATCKVAARWHWRSDNLLRHALNKRNMH